MALDNNHNFNHNKTTPDSLEEGDLVEFKRGPYSHWGVYTGNGDIVHYGGGVSNDGTDGKITRKDDKAKVCKDKFWNVVGEDKALKNNDNDRKLKPFDREQIVQNAHSKLGEGGYNLCTKNCEHFANWCRCGMEKSDQVEGAVEWTVGLLQWACQVLLHL